MAALLAKWQTFALASAVFASLTAIFGKIGVSEIESNLATFLRTIVILGVSAAFVTLFDGWQKPASLSARGLTFLVLSGAATGLSWLCYYRALALGPASQVAPVDKLSVAITILLAAAVLGEPLTARTLIGGSLIVAGSLVIALGNS